MSVARLQLWNTFYCSVDGLYELRYRQNHPTTAHINLSRGQHTMSGTMKPGQLSCSDPSGVPQFK